MGNLVTTVSLQPRERSVDEIMRLMFLVKPAVDTRLITTNITAC